MRTSLSLIGALWLAACSTDALADTIYKCVDASGKAAYTNLPCGKERKVSKEFAIDAPRRDERSNAAQDSEKRRLELAEEQFRQRQAARDRAYESQQQEVQMQERNEARAARQRQLAAEEQERNIAAQAALRKERRCNAAPKGPGC